MLLARSTGSVVLAMAVVGASPLAGWAASSGNAVLRLQERIERGDVVLTHEDGTGYLRSLLRALEIPISSQSLVFSKSSLEIFSISPQAPRAVYFNDSTYVAFIQGGPDLEVATIGKDGSPTFYILDQTPSPHPQFKREDTTCLHCHVLPERQANGTQRMSPPRLFMRSHFTDRDGTTFQTPLQRLIYSTTDQTPFEQRWGGWYVTGTHGNQRHMGNMFAPETITGICRSGTQDAGGARTCPDLIPYAARMDRSKGANITDLSSRFDTREYVSPHSDIVALMVLGHQVSVQNLIADVSRVASDDDVPQAIEQLVKAMLFVGEAPLTAPIAGTTSFATDFVGRGIHDSHGRSLRDLDLHQRLFRYPLSYLVYSDSFNDIPSAVQERIYHRLRDVLLANDTSHIFDHLTAADRKAILEILEETKPEFARLMAR